MGVGWRERDAGWLVEAGGRSVIIAAAIATTHCVRLRLETPHHSHSLGTPHTCSVSVRLEETDKRLELSTNLPTATPGAWSVRFSICCVIRAICMGCVRHCVLFGMSCPSTHHLQRREKGRLRPLGRVFREGLSAWPFDAECAASVRLHVCYGCGDKFAHIRMPNHSVSQAFRLVSWLRC